MRINEYFKDEKVFSKESIAKVPPKLYAQTRDWTCAIACIRTILSAFNVNMTEDEIINLYSLKPGPHYSRDIKKLNILKDRDVLYGCDYEEITIFDITEMMKKGYYIMLESMVNYSHWLVLLGYYAIDDFSDFEKYKLLCFDPYYNELRLINADEFIGMWIDGNYAQTGVKQDFIAISAT